MRPKPELSVSIVICTRNRPALLKKCLEAITHLEPMPDEMIVVDNTSGDKETEAAARKFSARYILEPVPGLSRARNRGLAESKSEIVAYLDDDALPTESWLEFLIEPFADSCVGVVTGRTILPDSQADDIIDEPARFLSNKDPLWIEIAAFGGLGIGTNMALRKAACTGEKIFDERLGRGDHFSGHGGIPRLRSPCLDRLLCCSCSRRYRAPSSSNPRRYQGRCLQSDCLFDVAVFRVSGPTLESSAISFSPGAA